MIDKHNMNELHFRCFCSSLFQITKTPERDFITVDEAIKFMKIVIKAAKGYNVSSMQPKQHNKIIKAYEELSQSKI